MRLHPKTKENGRKERKDKGIIKNSSALKIAGLNGVESYKSKEKYEQIPSENNFSGKAETDVKTTVSGSNKHGSENYEKVKESVMVSVEHVPSKTELKEKSVTSVPFQNYVATF